MGIFFQSFRSSSSGNCLALWTAKSSILVDCGLTKRDCESVLETHRRRAGTLDAVLVSHAHGDHMTGPSLRALTREGIPIHGHRRVIRQLQEWHGTDDWNRRPDLEAFASTPLAIGDFVITPIEVPHAPGVPNFGFAIAARGLRRTRRIVLCTDFHDYAGVLPHFVDADFIFVEANHDLQLLRQHPNPNSRYHLNNVKTASLLHHAVRQSASPPAAVMLGHLSEERNRRRIAIDEVQKMFERQRADIRFELDAAPARKPSAIVEI